MMLVDPVTGAKVRCEARKRWALAMIRPEDPTRMVVLFRTNNAEGLTTRAAREAGKAGRDVHVWEMRGHASHYGLMTADGRWVSTVEHRRSA